MSSKPRRELFIPARMQTGVRSFLLYLTACCGSLALGCIDSPPTTPEAITSPSRSEVERRPIDPADTSELVALPNGLYHRSCVHAVPNRGWVEQDGTVHAADGSIVPHANCLLPGPVPRGSPAVARSPWRRGPGSWTAPQINGYVEMAAAFVQGGHLLSQMFADWTSPGAPASYKSGNIIFIFPGAENSNTIAQPVLQLGNNGYYSPGDSWIGALYVCRGPGDPCYHGDQTIPISGGDQLSGGVWLSNCSGGKCDVNVQISNNTTLRQLTMTLLKAVALHGETNNTYNYAIAGALETYNIDTCSELPIGPLAFSNLALFDETGSEEYVTFSGVTNSVTPSCGYLATGGMFSVSLAVNNP